jgi:hypothetical protein
MLPTLRMLSPTLISLVCCGLICLIFPSSTESLVQSRRIVLLFLGLLLYDFPGAYSPVPPEYLVENRLLAVFLVKQWLDIGIEHPIHALGNFDRLEIPEAPRLPDMSHDGCLIENAIPRNFFFFVIVNILFQQGI